MIFAIGDNKPQIHPTAFVHPTAEISGKVKIGARASIWGGCILRGDIDWIEIGEESNVQDGSVFHTALNKPAILGKGVTVGHRAIVHGARVKDCSLIGMGAVLLDRSVVEENCFIGAGAVVKEGAVIPKGSLAVGIPARIVRPLEAKEVAVIVKRAADYVALSEEYRTALSQAHLA
jgi:carbonic anhydrase/acetyltransferase-like protein (isoleucine patch superfamily)